MDAPMVYPTTPFDTQAQQAPTAQTGTGENVESPGKAKGVLSKVKQKAKKLKNKMKKVTGTNTAATDHGDNDEHDTRDFNNMPGPHGKDFDDGAESYEDDEEEDDLSKPNNTELKYEKLRSIGALDKQGDGSETEVHDGVPVSTLADNTGTYWKGSDHDAPISAYKSAGPPDTLQASPTEYRNYAATDDPLLEEEVPKVGVSDGHMKDSISRGMEKDSDPLEAATLPEVNPTNLPFAEGPAEPHSKFGILDDASSARVAAPSSREAFEPDPSSGKSFSTGDESAVMSEGVSNDRKLEVGSPLEEYGGSGKENLAPTEEYRKAGENLSETSVPEFKPDLQTPNRSYDEPVDKDDEPVEPYPSVGKEEYDGRENLSTLTEKYSGTGEGNFSETSVREFKPVTETSGRSYDDLAEPYPSVGKSSTPVYDKIGVTDEDLSADRKLGVGLSSDKHARNGEANVLATPVPEFKPEVETSNLSDSEPAESYSNYGAVNTASASDRVVSYPEDLVKPISSLGKSSPTRDVSYPEDIVKPNPSFGKSSSPTHDKIAVLNDDVSPDGKLGVGLPAEEHSGNGKGNLLETSVPEFEELSGYREGRPSVPREADELLYKPVSEPEVGSSFASPPGISEEILNAPNAAVQSSGSGQGLHDGARQSQEPSEKDVEFLPRSFVDKDPLKGEDAISSTGANYGEQKPSFDVASEQSSDGEIGTVGYSDRESWGKWSADKNNNVKEATVTDHRNETQENSTVDAVGIADEVPPLRSVDAAKPPAVEDEKKDVEEEYYDPNEVKNNQFQEGFALGNAEEDALSGTLAGSAMEKLQGLKETVQSSLGYSNHAGSGVEGEDRSGLEGEERALSPDSYQQQKGGFVQRLKETVGSPLGYSKAGSDEAGDNDVPRKGELETNLDNRQQQPEGTYQVFKNAVASKLGYGPAEESSVTTKETESHASSKAVWDEAGDNDDVPRRKEELETNLDNRQQQPEGTYQVLKNAVASKLGYGPADESSVITKETESHASPAEPTSRELPYSAGGDYESVTKAGHGLSDSGDNADRAVEVSDQPHGGGILQGVKDRVISTLGYNSQPEVNHKDNSQTESVPGPAGEELSPSSYKQKLFDTTAAARDYLSSKVGYGNSNEANKVGYGNSNEDEKGGRIFDGEVVSNPSTHM